MKIKNNKIDILIEVLCLIMLIGTVLYLIVRWSSLPSELPMHYNAAGEIDRWGGKGELVIMPVIMCFTYFLITIVERFPQIWNTGVKVTPLNCVRVYRTLKYMLSTLKLLCVGIFAFLTVYSMSATPLPIWFTAAYIVLFLGDMAFWLIRLMRVK